MKEDYLNYVAGVFDIKGYIKDRCIMLTFGKDFDKVFDIRDMFNLVVETRLYKQKNRKSYTLQISGKENMIRFLEKICPYSIKENMIRKELMRLKHEKNKRILRKA